MSNAIPQATVDAIRVANDVIIEINGQTVNLFIPNNLDALDTNSIYGVKPSTLTFTQYPNVKVWVEWNPDMKRLRKLGFYSEEQLPIIAWFKSTPDVVLHSYIQLQAQYVPAIYDTEEFEVVDLFLGKMQDMSLFRPAKLAPRRV